MYFFVIKQIKHTEILKENTLRSLINKYVTIDF